MKYYKQETNCTCAVACARMMMSHFGFEVPDEAELALKLGTNVFCVYAVQALNFNNG